MVISSRTVFVPLLVCCVVVTLLLADVAAVPDHQPGQSRPDITGDAQAFYLRGTPATEKVAREAEAMQTRESLESFARRELNDYGSNPAKSNPNNCPRSQRPCRPR